MLLIHFVGLGQFQNTAKYFTVLLFVSNIFDPQNAKKKEAFSAPLLLRVFAIKCLIYHAVLTHLEIVAIALAVCFQLFRIAKYKIECVCFVCPFTAYTVILVPVIIGTYYVF